MRKDFVIIDDASPVDSSVWETTQCLVPWCRRIPVPQQMYCSEHLMPFYMGMTPPPRPKELGDMTDPKPALDPTIAILERLLALARAGQVDQLVCVVAAPDAQTLTAYRSAKLTEMTVRHARGYLDTLLTRIENDRPQT